MPHKSSTTITLRIPIELKEKLDREARAAGTSLNRHAVAALGGSRSPADLAQREAAAFVPPQSMADLDPSAAREAIKAKLVSQLTAQIESGVEAGLPVDASAAPGYATLRRDVLREAGDPALIETIPTAGDILTSRITVPELLELIAKMGGGEQLAAARARLGFSGADLIEARDHLQGR